MANLSGLGTVATGNPNPNKSYEVVPSPSDSVSSLSFSPKGNYLVATSWDNQVRCWEILAGSSQPKASISHDHPVLCSTWKDDGTTVFSGGCDKTVKMWPLMSGGQPTVVAMHDAPVKEVAWIQQMNLLVTGSWDKTLRSVMIGARVLKTITQQRQRHTSTCIHHRNLRLKQSHAWGPGVESESPKPPVVFPVRVDTKKKKKDLTVHLLFQIMGSVL